MKKLLTILCLVLLSSYSYSKEISRDQLVNRDGVYYEVNSTTPFTGSVGDYYDNGQLKEKQNFKDGERDGPYESFNWDGPLKETRNYKYGKLEGPYEVYRVQIKLQKIRRKGWFLGEVLPNIQFSLV